MRVAFQKTSRQGPNMLLVRLRSRAITEQKFAPRVFSALDAGQKGLVHVGEVVSVNVIYQHPPRNRGTEQQQPRAIAGARGLALRHGVENPVGELRFPVVEAPLTIVN